MEVSNEEVMASYQEGQRHGLAALLKKPDQTRLAQASQCHDRKVLTKLGRKSMKLCLPTPSNVYSVPYLTIADKR